MAEVKKEGAGAGIPYSTQEARLIFQRWKAEHLAKQSARMVFATVSLIDDEYRMHVFEWMLENLEREWAS